jgi:hypothetical protein
VHYSVGVVQNFSLLVPTKPPQIGVELSSSYRKRRKPTRPSNSPNVLTKLSFPVGYMGEETGISSTAFSNAGDNGSKLSRRIKLEVKLRTPLPNIETSKIVDGNEKPSDGESSNSSSRGLERSGVTSRTCPKRTERANSTGLLARPGTPPEEEKEEPCSRESMNSPSCATPVAEDPDRAEVEAEGGGARDGVWSRESLDKRPSSAAAGGGSGEAIARRHGTLAGGKKFLLVPLVPTRLIRPRAPQGQIESIPKPISWGGDRRIVRQFMLDPHTTW